MSDLYFSDLMKLSQLKVLVLQMSSLIYLIAFTPELKFSIVWKYVKAETNPRDLFNNHNHNTGYIK